MVNDELKLLANSDAVAIATLPSSDLVRRPFVAANPQNARVPNAKSSHRTASTSTALNAGRVPAGTPVGVADSGMFPV